MIQPTPPRASYRIQFHAAFTFRDATALVPYLDSLGISHLYASPIFRSTTGSTHGYDVCNYNQFDPEIGSADEFYALSAELKKHGMSILLDFVPNHMGISGMENGWWTDVLENGPASQYASYFDIDWKPLQQGTRKQVLLPILGNPYGQVLESGELKIVQETGKYFVEYFETKVPLSPQSVQDVLIPNGLEKLQHDCDLLDQLLARQHYRMCYWKVGTEEINYRRFFDVNGLAALRVEIPEVFQDSHRLLLQLFKSGDISGVRIDHIDGLAYPQKYLTRLREAIEQATGNPAWIVVEKILGHTERLPAHWPVEGTTGYEFISETTGLLLNQKAEKTITKGYASLTSRETKFSEQICQGKRLVMHMTMAGELSALSDLLNQIAESHWWYRDFTLSTLRLALQEMITYFPVYRSYVDPAEQVSEEDRRVLLKSIAAARRKNPGLDRALFDFIKLVFLPDGEPAHPVDEKLRQRFVIKFQQNTGPIMAKGVEDTAFYINNRFVAINEVGSDPGHFGYPLQKFHENNLARFKDHPLGLLATSTHDTKRSEDVRARLNVLSEMPKAWVKTLHRWVTLNRRHSIQVGEESAPDVNEQVLLYQVLVGSWPLKVMDEPELKNYLQRIQAYMVKALHEAKINSSWIDPNHEWDAAVKEFVSRILTRSSRNVFLQELEKLVEQIARRGAIKSLTQIILKLTSPGVPDIYQGNEIWDWSLVDPDNRRPVDYHSRLKVLESIDGNSTDNLWKNWQDGGIKMQVISRLLKLRRECPTLFSGKYIPLKVKNDATDNVIAFLRFDDKQELLVVLQRVSSDEETEIEMDQNDLGNGEWQNLFTETKLQTFAVSQILNELPFGIFIRYR